MCVLSSKKVSKNRNIVVTGARGFVGKHLVALLKKIGNFDVYEFDVTDNFDELTIKLDLADYIFHLAGVNRPTNPQDFIAGNLIFTQKILDHLRSRNKQRVIIFSSTVQAALQNPYGISKKQSEDAIFKFLAETNGQGFVYRLTNVFGKLCRPFYNSVVATFCYQTINGEVHRIDDPTKQIEFIYVDDIVKEFVDIINGHLPKADIDSFYYIRPSYKVTLGELSKKILSFNDRRISQKTPLLVNDFDKKLYETYLGYLNFDFSEKVK